jgi:hypothetical protein
MITSKNITLFHLMIDGQKMIGVRFRPDKVIVALIKGIDGFKWSERYQMTYLPNTKQHFSQIVNTFKGVAWINYNRFLTNKPINTYNEKVDVA